MSGRPAAAAAHLPRRGRRGGRERKKHARVARLRASHSYSLVLGLILVTFAFTVGAPDAPWTAGALVLLQCAALVCALWTSGVARAFSPPHWILVGVGASAVFLAIVDDGRGVVALLMVAAAVLTVATAIVIGLGVIDQGEANRDSVRGAIGVYVLIGLLFVFVYGVLAELGDTPLFAQGTDGTRSVRAYFSYVTLTTLGFGDFTIAGTLGRALAIVEALLGQLYLVTVVAVLVSRLSRHQMTLSSPRGDARPDAHADTCGRSPKLEEEIWP